MPRWVACLSDGRGADGEVTSMGGRVVDAGPGYALGLTGGPGTAALFRAGGLVAVGEGTLHNAAELRADVGAAPDCSDGELLLHLYARRGLAGVAAAEGMFALAVVDNGELVLLRGHVGGRTLFHDPHVAARPLSHARSGATRAAAPALRALRRWPALDTGPHLPAIASFL